MYALGGQTGRAQQIPGSVATPKKRQFVIQQAPQKEKKLIFVRGLGDVFPSPRLIPIRGQDSEPSSPGKLGFRPNQQGFDTMWELAVCLQI